MEALTPVMMVDMVSTVVIPGEKYNHNVRVNTRLKEVSS
jgi:hypothetical protein